MQQKTECNDVQHHMEMFANGGGSQNWQGTHTSRPRNWYNEGTHSGVDFH